MKISTVVIYFLLFLLPQAVHAQDSWKLKKDKNGIKVFSRKTKAYNFDELKVECFINGRISQLAAVLLDVNNHYKWSYKTITSTLIKSNSVTDVIFYNEIVCPWPLSNRDLVVQMTLKQHPSTKIITVVAKNINDPLHLKKSNVAIKYSNATWVITPINISKYKIDYTIQIDPGESAPAWLLNIFATDGPCESFKNLKETLNLSQYKQAKLPFIKDWN